ncbi:hypothetical protein [Confluentibacter sediminis]|uniref:hypothetical protein n=1 Tax=Confluentibacter sediminis TaxID=2219045 RepID=UPI000DAB48A3|nr:hypothetical protein [Confluentibacter sediminis]
MKLKLFIICFVTVGLTNSFAQDYEFDKTYVYFKPEQSRSSLNTEISNYETILKMAGYKIQAREEKSPDDYTVLWRKDIEGSGYLEVQMHYQFFDKYFIIDIDRFLGYTSSESVIVFHKKSTDPTKKAMYDDLYNVFVQSMIRLVKPASSLKYNEVGELLKNYDKYLNSSNNTN